MFEKKNRHYPIVAILGVMTILSLSTFVPVSFTQSGNRFAIQSANTCGSGMAVDANGNVYVADSRHHVVRRIDPSRKATIVAGIQDEVGYDGDNKPATQAKLSAPSDVAIDTNGNLLIVDLGNHRIRRSNATPRP